MPQRSVPGRRRLARSICAALAVPLLLPLAATAAEVSGRVADATGHTGFQGAVVRIPELGRSAVTGRDGRFRFADLPEGNYTLVVDYLGAESRRQPLDVGAGAIALGDIAIGADDADILDNVLVVGQAAGQAAALNQQRAADNIKVVVASDAIGQFPDQNAAESLQRLPGVTVLRDQGEGRFVVLRGLDPALNSTTINGVRIPGPEDDSRQVNLDVISSDLLETLEVTKTVTPDMDGDTLGGNIEIKSLSAFDRGGFSFAGRVEGSHNELRDKASPKLAASVTDLFSVGDGSDNFGVAASLSWFRRDFGSENIETAGFPFIEDEDGNEFPGLEEAEQRLYTITRERLSAALNFDYRPGENTELYWRTLYSRFEDDEVQQTNLFVFEDGDAEALSGTAGTFAGATVEKLTEARVETQDIFATTIGGLHYLDRWTLDYSLTHAYAGEEEQDAFGATFVQEGIDLGYDVGGDARRPRLFALDPAAFADASAYELDEIALEPYETKERENSFAVNAQRDFDFGDAAGFVKFGGKARLRSKDATLHTEIYGDFGDDYTLADLGLDEVDYPFGPFMPIAGGGSVLDFIRGHRGAFELDEEESAIENAAGSFDLDEDVYAAYVMGHLDWGTVRLIGGVRVEKTRYDAIGTQITIDEESGDGDPVIVPLSASKDYTDVLPGLHLRWELSDSVVFRAAATRTIARPSFAESAPRQLIEIEEDDGEFERNAEIGNPDLDPLQSNNFDLSLEYYPGDIGIASIGVFYKDITDFIVLADVAGTGPFVDFDEVIQPLNGDDAEVAGVELAWTQRFSFLPSPFDGLLFSANYTWLDSEATLPFRDETAPLPRQSDDSGNVMLGYEKHGLSLRLAATYRGDYLDEIGELDDAAFDRYADGHFQVDFSAKYRLTDTLQLYFNAININDEPFYAYYASPRYNSQYEQYGRTYELGLQAHF